MRLLHHIEKSEDRVLMLREFARVSSDTVVISLWVDGNYRARRLQKRLAQRVIEGKDRPQDRFVVPRKQIEAEIAEAGLECVGHVDFVKYWDKWRTYVLRVKA